MLRLLAVVALVLKILFADLERSKMQRDLLRVTQKLLITEEKLRSLADHDVRQRTITDEISGSADENPNNKSV